MTLVALLLVFFLYNRYRVAPELDISDLKIVSTAGERVDMNDFTGRPLIVSFAASWCGPCRKEINDMKKVEKELKDAANLLVISDERIETIQAFSAEAGDAFMFAQLATPFSALGIRSIPTTYLVNGKGKIVKKHTGYIDWSDPSARAHYLALMKQ